MTQHTAGPAGRDPQAADDDLLTVGEARTRLAAELAGERVRLAALEQDPAVDAATIDAVRRRVASLADAAFRITRRTG